VALSIAEEVAVPSQALGKPIEFAPITDEVARKGVARTKMLAYVIDGLLPFAEFLGRGKAARAFPGAEWSRGAPPPFGDWTHGLARSVSEFPEPTVG
jgi:hypothetical protein